MKYFILTSLSLSLAACSATSNAETPAKDTPAPASSSVTTDSAIFAGGCFWCVESDFEKLPGVIEAVSGYTGGQTVDPTYKQVTYKETGHYEAVKITFDPSQVSYDDLLDYYWRHVDPTDPDGQFCDKGSSYRTAIFARPDQLPLAQASKAEIEDTKPFNDPIVTPVLEAATFYLAEDYHQDYYKKNPLKYKFYRTGCGRDKRVKELWGGK